MSAKGADGWDVWSKFVLKELERFSESQQGIIADIATIKGDVAELKSRAGLWGLVGGMVPVAIVLTIKLLFPT